jgi:putative colanic acid biosynthesis glycosyltransferase
MNVLMVTLTRFADDTAAGGEVHLLDLISGFSKAGLNTHVEFPEHGKEGCLYLRKYGATGSYEEYAFTGKDIKSNFARIIQDFGIDIVHFQHFQTLPISLMKTTIDMNKKLIITLHDYFLWCENFFLLSPLKGGAFSFCSFEQDEAFCAECLRNSKEVWEVIYRRAWNGTCYSAEYIKQRRQEIGNILGDADLITSPSEFVRDSFLGLYPDIDNNRFFVVEHGNRRETATSKSRVRDPNKLRVAFLGEYKYEKGSLYFNELLNLFDNKRVDFYIIGNMFNTIESRHIDRVKIIGRYKRNELPIILEREGIDLILLLSPLAETFSYTLSEAIMNCVPVIATDSGALRERISKYGVGFLVPYENPVPRSAALLHDIADHPEILELFRNNCRKAALALKDIDSMVAEYIHLYKKLNSGA